MQCSGKETSTSNENQPNSLSSSWDNLEDHDSNNRSNASNSNHIANSNSSFSFDSWAREAGLRENTVKVLTQANFVFPQALRAMTEQDLELMKLSVGQQRLLRDALTMLPVEEQTPAANESTVTSDFHSWAAQCGLNVETVMQLTKQEFDDHRALRLMTLNDIEAMGLVLAQRRLLINAQAKLRPEQSFEVANPPLYEPTRQQLPATPLPQPYAPSMQPIGDKETEYQLTHGLAEPPKFQKPTSLTDTQKAASTVQLPAQEGEQAHIAHSQNDIG